MSSIFEGPLIVENGMHWSRGVEVMNIFKARENCEQNSPSLKISTYFACLCEKMMRKNTKRGFFNVLRVRRNVEMRLNQESHIL